MKTRTLPSLDQPLWPSFLGFAVVIGIALAGLTARAVYVDFEALPVGTSVDPRTFEDEVTLEAFSWFDGYSDSGFDDRYYFTASESGRVVESGGNRWLWVGDASPYDGIGERYIEISGEFLVPVKSFSGLFTSSEGAQLVYRGVSPGGPFSGSQFIPWDEEWVPVNISAPAGGHLTGFEMIIHEGYSPRGTVGSMELDNLRVQPLPEGGPGWLGLFVLFGMTLAGARFRMGS